MEITVIDSGLGGITFSENLKKEIKYFEIKLLIDQEGFPYGNKDLIWLKERLFSLVEKSETDNIIIACTECKQRNYDSQKNKKNDPDRIEVKKYCKFCKKHTVHKETK